MQNHPSRQSDETTNNSGKRASIRKHVYDNQVAQMYPEPPPVFTEETIRQSAREQMGLNKKPTAIVPGDKLQAKGYDDKAIVTEAQKYYKANLFTAMVANEVPVTDAERNAVSLTAASKMYLDRCDKMYSDQNRIWRKEELLERRLRSYTLNIMKGVLLELNKPDIKEAVIDRLVHSKISMLKLDWNAATISAVLQRKIGELGLVKFTHGKGYNAVKPIRWTDDEMLVFFKECFPYLTLE